jgi:hypothetical protein
MAKNTIIVGDVHGNLDALIRTLYAAGAIDDLGDRKEDWRIVQVGDLMNMAPFGVLSRGFYPIDLETLEWAKDRIAPEDQVVGNHEVWYTHNGLSIGDWHGRAQLHELQPELMRLIQEEVRNGRFNAAVEVDGMLVTHAGLHPHIARFYEGDVKEIAAKLNEHLIETATGGDLYTAIMDPGTGIFWLRPEGEPFWGAWRGMQKTEYTQVVGHSPDKNHPRFYKDKNLWIIDSGGYMTPGRKHKESEEKYQERIAEFVPTVGALVKRENETEFTPFDADEVYNCVN